MKRTPLILAAVSLLCVAWSFDRVDPEDGKIRLEQGGGVPDGYERGVDRYVGVVSYCDYAWWIDKGAYNVQIMFCWAEQGRDGWKPEYATPTAFLNDFYSTNSTSTNTPTVKIEESASASTRDGRHVSSTASNGSERSCPSMLAGDLGSRYARRSFWRSCRV